MDEETLCVPKALTSPFCRICITIENVNFYIYEPMSEKSGTVTLHLMLARVFPEFFNNEQVQNDESMCLPNRICQECRNTIAKAYQLYELCKTSTGRLEKLLSIEEVVFEETDKKLSDEIEEENQLVIQDEAFERSRKTAKISTDVMVDDSQRSVHKLRTRRNTKRNDRSKMPSLTEQEPLRKLRARIYRTKPAKQPIADEDSIESIGSARESQLSPTSNEDAVMIKQEFDDVAKLNSLRDEPILQQREQKRRKSKRELRVGKIKSEKHTKPGSGNGNPDVQSDKPETKIDLYRCQLCVGPTYTSPTELTEHLKKNHPDQISSCDKCPKVFMSEQAYQHHQYCHAIGRSHFCMFCDKGFVTEELLKGHVRTHTHRTDYLCFLCGKEFSNSSNLRQHVRRHNGEKPFTCDQCPMRFTTKGYLTRHQQTHTKIKKFACDTCGALFTRQYTMVKHQLLHTGTRFFSCEVCKMSFTSSDHVKRHMRTHTGEKPYKCGCCGRAFSQSNDMVKHMRTHLGDNAYQCDRCDASYRLLSELRNHYKQHYQPGDNSKGCSTVEEEKEIRFTSMNILNRQFDKKP